VPLVTSPADRVLLGHMLDLLGRFLERRGCNDVDLAALGLTPGDAAPVRAYLAAANPGEPPPAPGRWIMDHQVLAYLRWLLLEKC